MGIFHTQVDIVNIAPVTITVRFDGQEMSLPSGPGKLPSICVEHAKNQNPVMGSEDPYNPHISGARYLIGVVGTDDRIEPLTEEEWADHLGQPARLNNQQLFEDKYGNDPKAKLVLHGKVRKAASRSEAGGAPRGEASFTRKD
jgi:hypothetical protein